LGTKTRVGLILVVLLGVACGGSPTPTAATSPVAASTADAATVTYVALVRGYWTDILAADGATGSTNEASRACLGTLTNSAPPNAALIEPALCHTHAVAILSIQLTFLDDLKGTIAPEQFADDDRVFRSQVPRAITAMKALVSVSTTSNKQAIFDASNAYVDIMLGSVIPAMDDVDPATKHY